MPQNPADATATVQTPTTAAELQVMMARRDEFASQLQSLGDRQSQLVNQRYNASVGQNPELVRQLDVSIRELTQRIARIEREKLATDDAISAAVARGVASTENTPSVTTITLPGVEAPGFPGRTPDSRIDGERVGAGLALVLLTIFTWRWFSRRAEKLRAKTLPAESAATKDLRLAVETIALEVERISEGQRFITKLLAERGEADPAQLERGRSEPK